MIIFLFIAIVGLIFSIVTHFGVLFGVLELSRLLMIVLNAGLAPLICFVCFYSSRLDKKVDKEMHKKALANACPRWMNIIFGLSLLYGVAILAYFFVAGICVKLEISFLELTMDKLHKGITSVHIACYAFFIPFYYHYRYLKKETMRYCTNGHLVTNLAKICELCGAEVEEPAD